MALPASGQITLNQVNVELGLSGTAQIGMNDAAVRGLFGIVVRLAVVVQGVFVPLIMPVPLAEAEVLSLQCH